MSIGRFVIIGLFLSLCSVRFFGGIPECGTDGQMELYISTQRVEYLNKAFKAFGHGCVLAKKARLRDRYKQDAIEQLMAAMRLYTELNDYDGVFKSTLEVYEIGELPKEIIDILIDFYLREQGDLFKDAYRVEQNEFAILTRDSEIPMLGTDSIGECVALVLYHAESQTVCLAHIDKGTTEKSIEGLLELLPDEKFQATLIGGISSKDKDSKDNYDKIMRVLKGKHSVKILSINDGQALDALHYKAIVVGKDGTIQKGIPDGGKDQQWLRDGLIRLEDQGCYRPLVKAYDESFQHTILKLTPNVRSELKNYRNKRSKEILDEFNKTGFLISELSCNLPGFAVAVKGIVTVLQAEAEALEDIAKKVNSRFSKPVESDIMHQALEIVLNRHELALGSNSSAGNAEIVDKVEVEVKVLLAKQILCI